MALFDVYRPKGKRSVLVLDVQADLLSELDTRVIVPLKPWTGRRSKTIARLLPIIEVNGKDYQLMTANVGTILVSDLVGPVANLEAQRTAIIDAIDFLLQGF
jgi:toxin CcdB